MRRGRSAIPKWTLERHSALVTTAHRAGIRVFFHARERQKQPVTEHLTQAMAAVVAARGVPLGVVSLHERCGLVFVVSAGVDMTRR